jgi:hypothetical protein
MPNSCTITLNLHEHDKNLMETGQEDIAIEHTKSLLTLPNIQFIIQGLDSLLQTNLDGDQRIKVIELRDELLSYINSIFSDYA